MNKYYIIGIMVVSILVIGLIFNIPSSQNGPNVSPDTKQNNGQLVDSYKGEKFETNGISGEIVKLPTKATINGKDYNNFKIRFTNIGYVGRRLYNCGEYYYYLRSFSWAKILVDDTGIYWASFSPVGYGSPDLVIIKLDFDGQVIWAQKLKNDVRILYLDAYLNNSNIVVYVKSRTRLDSSDSSNDIDNINNFKWDNFIVIDKNTGNVSKVISVDSTTHDFISINYDNRKIYGFNRRVISMDLSNYSVFTTSGDTYPIVVPLLDGTYLLIREQTQYTFGGYDLQFTIVNPNGTVVNSFHIGTNRDDHLHILPFRTSIWMNSRSYFVYYADKIKDVSIGPIITSNSAYLLVRFNDNTNGRVYANNNILDGISIMKINRANGEIEWVKKYKFDGFPVYNAFIPRGLEYIDNKLILKGYMIQLDYGFRNEWLSYSYYVEVVIDPNNGNIESASAYRTQNKNFMVLDIYHKGTNYWIAIEDYHTNTYYMNPQPALIQTDDLGAFGIEYIDLLTDQNLKITVTDVTYSH